MLLDISVGILVAHLVTSLSGVETQGWHLVLGVAFALLPDLDAVIHYFKVRETAAYAENPTDHRDGLHYPLVYLPVGTATMYVVAVVTGLYELVILFLLCSVFHFLHDSIGTGWGVKWLWPLDKRNYKLLCEKDGSWSKRLLVTWNPGELRKVIIQHGDPDWVVNFFVRPLVRAVTFQGFPPKGNAIMLIFEIIVPVMVILYFILN